MWCSGLLELGQPRFQIECRKRRKFRVTFVVWIYCAVGLLSYVSFPALFLAVFFSVSQLSRDIHFPTSNICILFIDSNF